MNGSGKWSPANVFTVCVTALIAVTIVCDAVVRIKTSIQLKDL